MADSPARQRSVRVTVIADVESNAIALVDRVLKPAGIEASLRGSDAPPPDVLVVDVTQLRGDPLANLRNYRSTGDDTPAILLAAHFPLSRLRDLFRLGVSDFLLKPYRPEDLRQAIFELSETRSRSANTQILAGRMEGIREQLRRRTEEIRMLSEIGRTVVSLGDLNGILRSVVEAAAFVTDAEEAAIYLADPGSKELVLRASKQAGERHATLQRLRTTDTIVGEVFHTGRPILRQPSSEESPVKVQTGFLVQSTVNVPLRVKQHVVGVLGVYNRLSKRSFSEHHLTLLIAIADWAGVALEQAALRRGTQPIAAAPQPTASDEAAVSAAAPELLQGLDEAIEMLEACVQSDGSNGQQPPVETLTSLLNHLRQLRRLPVVELDAEQSQEMINLPVLVEEVVEEMRGAAQMRGLVLNSERSDDIPLFRGDPAKVRQILEALVSAAVRRTRKGRIVLEAHRFDVLRSQSDEFPLTVNVNLHDGAWAAVRVSDSSPGLSPDTIQAITAPATEPDAGRMGPGLSMGEVRLIIESMGGVMWYEHTPASTSITFALPIP